MYENKDEIKQLDNSFFLLKEIGAFVLVILDKTGIKLSQEHKSLKMA